MRQRKHKIRKANNEKKILRRDGLPSPTSLTGPSPLAGSTSARLPGDAIKISEMLLKVAMPLLEVYGKSYETIHAILHLTVIAWNLSIVQDATEKEILQHIMGIFPKEYYTRDIAALIDNIQMLKNRKMELFHDIQEVITKIELRQTEAGYDLTAYGAPVGALRRHSADAAAD